jgi:hypothetical protein
MPGSWKPPAGLGHNSALFAATRAVGEKGQKPLRKKSASMPTLFRLLLVLGVIAGVVSGSLYVLAEYFQPEPKEISKSLRGVTPKEFSKSSRDAEARTE